MPIFEGKRLEFVGVKYNQQEKDQFEKIGAEEDRPISYVVRELSLRGLISYLQDNNLKPTEDEIELAKTLLKNYEQELAANSKKKIPIGNGEIRKKNVA